MTNPTALLARVRELRAERAASGVEVPEPTPEQIAEFARLWEKTPGNAEPGA